MLCYHAECHYAECGIVFIIMLSVIMQSVIMLSVAKEKCFITLTPGPNVNKPFKAEFRNACDKLECLSMARMSILV